MKPLLWKEFHENLKWATIPLLVMFGYMANVGTCLCGNFFMFVSFVGAVFGGALGIVQMTFESHGDRRALLLHRPINRTRIFLAKIISGAALYLLALGVPLAYYLVTAFIPGHVAPQLPLAHRWPLVFPWFADVLTGLVYYLAGGLAGLRPGRWFGSRCLGFPAAFLATFLVWNAAEFWQALCALLLISSVVGLAAWGGFLTAGDTDAQPPLAKFGLAGTFLLALSVLSVQGKSSLEYRMFRSFDDDNHAYYQITVDGEVRVVEQIGNQAVRVRDLAGHEFEEFQHMSYREAHAELRKSMSLAILAHSMAWHGEGRSYRTNSRYAVPISNRTLPPGEAWCFVPELGLLCGYDKLSRRRIGSIGPDGFSADGESPRTPFRGPLDYSPIRCNPDFLAFPGAVYDVDFATREAHLLFSPAAGEIVHGAWDGRDETQVAPLHPDDKSIPGIRTFQRDDHDDKKANRHWNQSRHLHPRPSRQTGNRAIRRIRHRRLCDVPPSTRRFTSIGRALPPFVLSGVGRAGIDAGIPD